MDFRVLTLNDSIVWKNILSKVELYDIYHTPTYHSVDFSGEPRLLVFEEKEEVQALPLIFREIPGTIYKDVTSVYGYAGWIRTHNTSFVNVYEIIERYFQQEKIISAFSRLHPLISGSDQFFRGEVIDTNLTTAIDTRIQTNRQFNSYAESVRRSIRKAEKKGVNVRLAETAGDFEIFIRVYTSAMKQLNSNSFYYFSREYFEKMWKNPDFDCYILIAELENNPIGVAMFTVCNEIMQYHLGGVVQEYIYLSPLKLIIDRARLLANEQSLKIFHLGGGHGGNNDSLYTFKSRMTTLRFDFKIWKWIVNPVLYKELSKGKGNSLYFPLYRKEN